MIRLASASYFATRKKEKEKFEARCQKLVNEYVEFSNRRNEIAHGSVQRVFVTGKKTKRGERRGAIGFYLLPSFYNPKKFMLDQKFTYQYTSSDVLFYKQEFVKLQLRIHGFREEMARAS